MTDRPSLNGFWENVIPTRWFITLLGLRNFCLRSKIFSLPTEKSNVIFSLLSRFNANIWILYEWRQYKISVFLICSCIVILHNAPTFVCSKKFFFHDIALAACLDFLEIIIAKPYHLQRGESGDYLLLHFPENPHLISRPWLVRDPDLRCDTNIRSSGRTVTWCFCYTRVNWTHNFQHVICDLIFHELLRIFYR